MFYQSKNSLDNDLFRVESGSDFSFPAHFHSSFELIAVEEGEMDVTVDKKQYHLTSGKAVLVFPNQMHALHTPVTSKHVLCIFSPQRIRAYSHIFLTKLPQCHIFEPDAFYIQSLHTLHPDSSELQIKGVLYSLCAVFDRSAVYIDRQEHREDLLLRIFQFVENHYSEDCSLTALAADTSYHGVYLSRYFKQSTGISFTDHVNRYRVNEAAYMLKNSGKKILEIAMECGFDSLRSFNRNFKSIMGMPPHAYRNSG